MLPWGGSCHSCGDGGVGLGGVDGFEDEDGGVGGMRGGETFLEVVGVDAGEVAAGFDFGGGGGAGGEVELLEGFEEFGFGVGEDLVELEGSESGVVKLGTDKITSVDGEGGEVERSGELAAGEGGVEFVEEHLSRDR